MESRIILQMTNIFDTSCGKVIKDEDIVATRKQSFRQVRPDEARSASYQITQDFLLAKRGPRIVGSNRQRLALAGIFAVAVAVRIRIVAIGVVIVGGARVHSVQHDTQEAGLHRRKKVSCTRK